LKLDVKAALFLTDTRIEIEGSYATISVPGYEKFRIQRNADSAHEAKPSSQPSVPLLYEQGQEFLLRPLDMGSMQIPPERMPKWNAEAIPKHFLSDHLPYTPLHEVPTTGVPTTGVPRPAMQIRDPSLSQLAKSPNPVKPSLPVKRGEFEDSDSD